jgi:23S rRNA pseudouridine2605 synthase
MDRVQGSNVWLKVALREGKNREIRRIMDHFGWPVTRLIRLSFGPFQLGNLAEGAVEEVTGKVLKEQLGALLGTGGARPRRPTAAR